MSEELKLLPCPFCGGTPELIDEGYKVVQCTKCGVASKAVLVLNDTHGVGNKKAKKEWNTRPIEDAIRAELAILGFNLDNALTRNNALENELTETVLWLESLKHNRDFPEWFYDQMHAHINVLRHLKGGEK